MTILALEFSSLQRSVAVARAGTVLAGMSETGGRSTAAFAMIERVLADAKIGRKEIDVIVVGLGPGSYTGIRAAIAMAQGWQLATGLKTAGISSVEAIVAQAQAEKIFGRVNVVIDAQRGELYLAVYDISAAGITEIEPLRIVLLAEIQSARANETFIGPEVTRWFPAGKTIFPSASTLACLAAPKGAFVPAEKIEPIYLRETTFVKAPAFRIHQESQ